MTEFDWKSINITELSVETMSERQINCWLFDQTKSHLTWITSKKWINIEVQCHDLPADDDSEAVVTVAEEDQN